MWPAMALGLVSVPLALAAQTTAPGAETDWRRANEAVGQLKRGHADVLKWEQTNMPPEATPGLTRHILHREQFKTRKR
jgi:hypothetical protein